MGSLKIGWAETSITPEKKISLYGQFAERISEYVEKPLTATALVIENGEDQAIFCSCDLAETTWNLVLAVREKLRDNGLGLDPDKIIINAIHTHTGPSYPGKQRSEQDDGRKPFDHLRVLLESFLAPGQSYEEKENISNNPEIATEQEIWELLMERIPSVILEAWKNRKAGSFCNGFGRAVVGHCRRAAYSDGSAQMWGETNTAVFEAIEGGNDSGVELLYLLDEAGELTGIVCNVACPAQCVQHRHFVSPDFWGEVKLRLRKHFGEKIYLLPQCAAAGDQCPVDLIRWVQPESDLNDPNCTRSNPPKRKADPSMFDLSGMRKTGKRLANEIIEVWNEGMDAPQTDVPLRHEVLEVQLPLRRATLTDVANARRAIKEYLQDKKGNVNYIDLANLQVHLGALRRFELQEAVDTLDTEIHVIRLGAVAIATSPFELFLDFGNQIRARSLAEQTFTVQLANGSEGYVPTEKAEKGGHYSAFISSGQIGHVGGEMLVRHTLKKINQMFS